MNLDRSVRSVDLRIEIGEYCGFDFERRVRESNSNSLAAIYFTRDQLDVIAAELGIEGSDAYNKPGLQDAIRQACGCDPRDVDGLDWIELRAIIETAEIPVEESPYHDLSEPREMADADESDPPSPGIWADWGGESV